MLPRKGNRMTITEEQLADLLTETGQHHHRAFIDSDGVDPEWQRITATFMLNNLT